MSDAQLIHSMSRMSFRACHPQFNDAELTLTLKSKLRAAPSRLRKG